MGETGFSAAEDIARAFVRARRDRRALATYPGPAPETMDQAYQVQDAALRHDGRAVGGWKLGKINPPHLDRLGANRLAGPIFTDQIVTAQDGAPVDMPVFRDGFAAAEAEFLLRIGAAPEPGKDDYTIETATPLIDAVHAGIEVASSPYPRINADGPPVTASDYGNNNGLVIGDAIERWRDGDVNAWRVELLINGAVIGDARAADMLDGPFGAAAFLFNLAARRGIALTAGQWISSGAVTGVHPVAIGDTVEARFDGRYPVTCTITA
ncbi:2-keto-4-pentenoate hydratase [Sphingomonas sp. Leaf33]|uniref:2-keto-4-pentenoate hydratase n=1 Tax=Sphingomonas sp. Leaf33 TaxID=1736215 RepID=UPI0006FE1F2E|nr:2-keto-4-pentenoate hydratase [Sphingomonas sp. Leaf33]KQN19493.1 2-keto-4-pentenoate hydratase [Sphingomonas sp. Leaf33]